MTSGKKIKTIFLGTGWESLATLKVLNESKDFEIVAVITAPDKPVGRRQEMTPSEVKEYAIKEDIPVVHTEKIVERYIKTAEKYQPELVVCKAFGEIIPKEFLKYPKYGSINIHFSLLPKYRGAVPIQKAILDGEKKTGITIMLMSDGLDEGDILEMFEEDIKEKDTNLSLRERLVKRSSEVLIPTLKKWINGEITPQKQNHSEATYCWQKDISKENAEIKWNTQTPEYIERMIRAFIPWPITWTRLRDDLNKNLAGKSIKIFKAELVDIPSEKDSGILWSNGTELFFATLDPLKSLKLTEFQIEGRKKTNAKEFLGGIGRSIT